MNTTFNATRFLHLVKWNIMTDSTSPKTRLLYLSLAFLAVQALNSFFLLDLTVSPAPFTVVQGMKICLAIAGALTMYYASGLLGNARTKQQRITLLMLPANNAEKFWARMAYCFIVLPLMIAASLAAATVLRMLLELLFGHSGIVTGFAALDFPAGLISNLGAQLWGLSIFLLGGAFFSKRPFIWTCVTIIAVSLAWAIGLGLLITMIDFSQYHFVAHLDNETPFVVAMYLFTALNTWLSYLLFKRVQVSQHKWFNL